MDRVQQLRDELEARVLQTTSGSSVNGCRALRLPNTSSLTIEHLDAADAVDELASRGVCVANGSACSSGSEAPSHVLTAMSLPNDLAFQTLRVSLSLDTSEDDLNLLVSELSAIAAAPPW
ncbi:aminotransferase class V-fold PLP-dependent enzyme [Rhizobium ruizarguesonis]